MEAVAAKSAQDEEKLRKQAEVEAWKKDKTKLNEAVGN